VKRFWIILAGVFAGIAVVLFLRGDYEQAFVSATVGSVSWFLSYRVQMKTLINDNEPPETIDDDDWEADEEEQT
jgi:hypothetical protein